MSQYDELKRLAEHHRSLGHAYTVATPSAVLALIAENERLDRLIILNKVISDSFLAERDQLKAELERAQLIGRLAYNFDGYKAVLDERDQLRVENERLTANVKLNLCDYPAIHRGDVDLLVAFVTGASQIELAKVHNCTPPNISRKIRRVKERLGWREGMLVSEIRDRAEQLRALASQGAVVTADLMAERDQLRAEIAGLKTGYQAYERVNAELKAEVEKLRNAAAPLGPVNGDQLPAINSKVLIHLSSCDAWVEHTVVGYYAWEDLGANEYLHRVFIRVRDADGYINARLLKDVRSTAALGQGEQS